LGRGARWGRLFVAGNSVDDLLSLSTSELRESPREEDEDLTVNVPYRVTQSGLVWDKQTQNGPVPTPLTNLSTRIVADVAEDDDAEVKHHFQIEARLGERRVRLDVPAGRFAPIGWPTEHLGASALVYPGMTLKDHARAVIQLLSEDVDERRVYTHNDWRQMKGIWAYLHGDGVIAREGAGGRRGAPERGALTLPAAEATGE
jgi:hypothetical protein